jgi:hypothetical protein
MIVTAALPNLILLLTATVVLLPNRLEFVIF